MINSKQVIELTGISRATLNNYVSLGILPSPTIKAPREHEGRATRLGYFDDGAVERIRQVQRLKKRGRTMAQIARELSAPLPNSEAEEPRTATERGTDAPDYDSLPLEEPLHASAPNRRGRRDAPQMDPYLSFGESLEASAGPAYMVNNSFELTWWNNEASRRLFGAHNANSPAPHSRNLLQLLFEAEAASDSRRVQEMLRPHLIAAKRRLSQQAFMKIYRDLDGGQLQILKDLIDQNLPAREELMLQFPIMLRDDANELSPYDLHIAFYQQGVLFSYTQVQRNPNYALEFLSGRDRAVNELQRRDNPSLTDVAVLAASLQDAKRLRSELSAAEYFKLINSIKQESASIFTKYYGTYGKHGGAGMLFYFLPQPKIDYRRQAIQCALELQHMMLGLNQRWQARKAVLGDVHLNMGLSQGREWLGSYHADSQLEFAILGQTLTHALRLSDFGREGVILAAKNIVEQLPNAAINALDFGITRRTQLDAPIFLSEGYARVGDLIENDSKRSEAFDDIASLPITEIRASK